MALADQLEELADQARTHSAMLSQTSEKELNRILKQARQDMTTARIRIDSLAESAGLTFAFFSKDYLIRMLFVFCLFLIASFSNAFFSCLAGYRNPQISILAPTWAVSTTHPTLPDIGHDVIGFFTEKVTGKDYIDWYSLPDIFVQLLGFSMGLHIVLHPRRFLILRRLLFLFSCLYLLRSFTIIITSLPDASPICAEQFSQKNMENSYKNYPEEAIRKSFFRALKMMLAPQDYITCGDMVFSGHTSFISLCMLVFNQYCRGFKGSFVIRWGIYVMYGLGLIAIIGTKLHYTLDVAIAIMITVTLWRTYHNAVRSEKIMTSQVELLKWL